MSLASSSSSLVSFFCSYFSASFFLFMAAATCPLVLFSQSFFLASAFLGTVKLQELVYLGITELFKLRGLVVSKFHTSLWAGARLEFSS